MRPTSSTHPSPSPRRRKSALPARSMRMAHTLSMTGRRPSAPTRIVRIQFTTGRSPDGPRTTPTQHTAFTTTASTSARTRTRMPRLASTTPRQRKSALPARPMRMAHTPFTTGRRPSVQTPTRYIRSTTVKTPSVQTPTRATSSTTQRRSSLPLSTANKRLCKHILAPKRSPADSNPSESSLEDGGCFFLIFFHSRAGNIGKSFVYIFGREYDE